jgi:hypothetical protein
VDTNASDTPLQNDPLNPASPANENSPPRIKRGPGRPPGARNKVNGEAPPETVNPVDPGAGAPPRRGRPPGSRKTITGEEINALAQQIQGLHIMASMATGIPELQLTPNDAVLLANGILAVSKEYGLAISGKTAATLQLLGACAMVYVPRLIAVKQRADARRQAAADFETAKNGGAVDAESPVH